VLKIAEAKGMDKNMLTKDNISGILYSKEKIEVSFVYNPARDGGRRAEGPTARCTVPIRRDGEEVPPKNDHAHGVIEDSFSDFAPQENSPASGRTADIFDHFDGSNCFKWLRILNDARTYFENNP
jgi:hypothetical protein